MLPQSITMIYTFQRALVVLLLTLVASSCRQSREKLVKVDPSYHRYISGFTMGVVSRSSVIQVQLAVPYREDLKGGEFAGIEELGQFSLPDTQLLQEIFSFDPPMSGKAVWVDRQTIAFVPEKWMPSNQLYRADFKLGKVCKTDKKHKLLSFNFSTRPQHISAEFYGLELDHQDLNMGAMMVRGSIHFDDVMDTTEVKKCVTWFVNGEERLAIWESGYEGERFYFRINNLPRTEKEGHVVMKYSGEPIGSFGKGEEMLKIPAKGDFSITNVRMNNEEDQTIDIYFSENMLYGQNTEGLITLSGVEQLKTTVMGNMIRVFPPQKLKGNYELKVYPGLRNSAGHRMKNIHQRSVYFAPPAPGIRLVGSGNILPNSNGLIFPFESVGLKSVDVYVYQIREKNVFQFLQINDLDGNDEMARVAKLAAKKTINLPGITKGNQEEWKANVLNLEQIIAAEPGAIYSVILKAKKHNLFDSCARAPRPQEDEEESEESADPFEYWSDYNESNSGQDSAWNEWTWRPWSLDNEFSRYSSRGNHNPCSWQAYHQVSKHRNVLASNIGLVHKMDEQHQAHVVVSDMVLNQPMAGVTVKWYDYNQEVIAQGISDAEGMLKVLLKTKPFVAVAYKDQQRTYLKVKDAYSLSLSKFEVEGQKYQQGVKGFIYTERGVWRPGDSLFINFMLEDEQGVLPDKHPVQFSLIDPMGKEVQKLNTSKHLNRVYSFHTKTDPEAPSGNYLVLVKVGNRQFTERLKIETIKPNRLKLHFRPKHEQILTAETDSIGLLSARWLHGSPGKNLKANITASLFPAHTSIKGFSDYQFQSPLRHFESAATEIFNGDLSERGEANIRANMPDAKGAAGLLTAQLVTRVYEPGGDFSIDRFQVLYSPFNKFIGIKAPNAASNGKQPECGKTYPIQMVAISPEGKPQQVKTIRLQAYKIQRRWWYERYQENFNAYVNGSAALVMLDTLIEVNGNKVTYQFLTEQVPARYLLIATDPDGGHQTGTTLSTDWPGWARQAEVNSENATMLQLAVNKTVFAPGEEIKLTLPGSNSGKALVSLERGGKILQTYWINTTTSETRHTLKATPEMSPYCYIHVTALQAHAATKSGLPMRMYGVVPVKIEDPQTVLKPIINCNKTWEPEQKQTIKVKEQNGKAITYTLAVVDEGLLDLTRFKTPDPWPIFYAKEALTVKTWDIYDQVIGAYNGKMDRLLNVGGDEGLLNNKTAKANRFKPMVRFLGPFELKAGAENSHHIDIPEYVGAVKVMVVARQDKAYGQAEQSIEVKKPIMLLATLPRVLGPNEVLSIPISVFNLEKGKRDIQVKMQSNDLLTPIDGSTKSIQFDEPGDELVYFKVKVNEALGVAKLQFTASGGGNTARHEVEIQVRPSNPEITETQQYTIEPGKSFNKSIELFGFKGSNQLAIEVSAMPPINLHARLDYLLTYPHGCIEQTTSGVFPQVFIKNLIQLTPDQAAKTDKNIKAGIRRLNNFQTSRGGFAYWPGEDIENEWGTNYAGHFMLEASKAGYTLPEQLLKKWLTYQQNQAKAWHGNQPSQQLVQAYRLYTLALAGQPELAVMNRMRESETLSHTARWRLAAAYLLAGQKQTAIEMIKNLETQPSNYRELSNTYGSASRDEAMILETLCLLNLQKQAEPLALKLAGTLSANQWLSTQETGYLLLSMSKYALIQPNDESSQFNWSINSKNLNTPSTKVPLAYQVIDENALKTQNQLVINNTGHRKLYVKTALKGVPKQDQAQNASNGLSLSLRYFNSQNQEINPNQLSKGTDVLIEVTIKNTSKNYLQELALTHLFPTGWEVHNNRMDQLIQPNSQVRYQNQRDDRVLSYFNLSANQEIKIQYRVTAVYEGDFYLPTVYIEAMYNNAINASVKGNWITVKTNTGNDG